MKESGAVGRRRQDTARGAQAAEAQFQVRKLANLQPDEVAQVRSTLDLIFAGQLQDPDAAPPAPEPPPEGEEH